MTEFENRGEAPIVLETYNTNTFYVASGTGQFASAECKRVILLADPDNSSNVLLGSEVGTYTFPLEAGLGLTLELEDLDQIFYQTTGGDKLHALVLSEV